MIVLETGRHHSLLFFNKLCVFNDYFLDNWMEKFQKIKLTLNSLKLTVSSFTLTLSSLKVTLSSLKLTLSSLKLTLSSSKPTLSSLNRHVDTRAFRFSQQFSMIKKHQFLFLRFSLNVLEILLRRFLSVAHRTWILFF